MKGAALSTILQEPADSNLKVHTCPSFSIPESKVPSSAVKLRSGRSGVLSLLGYPKRRAASDDDLVHRW
jgi:hypothetical protein